MAALHLLITGRVQGVGFRYSMGAAALEHGARGWVRNRRDGRVEAVIDGDATAIAAMLRWAQRGPRAAHVQHVATREAAADELAPVGGGFEPLSDA
jgi:acylphosphatase